MPFILNIFIIWNKLKFIIFVSFNPNFINSCNHLNLKILIHIFTIICLIVIIIIMRGENFVAHLDGLGGTSVCRGTLVAHHWLRSFQRSVLVNVLKYGGILRWDVQSPKAEGRPLSAVNVFRVTLHICILSPCSCWGRAMLWWQGSHLTWVISVTWLTLWRLKLA
jgi:hypothetical protein